ncbi:MAG: gliding motility-associated C-terminal domain-containing protein [Flavobacteriales bacterium]|nr:gliding motility-associated C-terminal domain-containing protein [Flavobacteriales bacterium]
MYGPHSIRATALCRFALAFAVVCAAAVRMSAQPYWSRNIGGSGNEHVADVKVDATGALYVTGEFFGTVTFMGQTFTSSGAADAFVAKVNADGTLAWFTQGGGIGIDRGVRLCRGPGSALAVVGEFMGSANFQGNIITSAGGGVDVFVAVLDAVNGQVQWIRRAGGATGADKPYGVSVAPNGQVTVAGEFRGTAQWGGLSLTSTTDPGSGLPSADVFIACYSTSGAELWVKQGAAKYYDHAVDVVHDPLGNIYVCGQFSDTITFDAVHYNDLNNASFLLKLDAAGNEQWFRRFGGATLNQVRDMQWTTPDGLVLTGDLQGNMVFIDNVPDFINGPAPYAYYLLRVDPTGELVAQGAWGSQSHVTVRGLDQRADTVAVLGAFACRFDALADHYNAPALFMATGDQDLFVARHARLSLALMDAQQFGGQKPKLAGQIASLAAGDLVFCGSFEETLLYPCRDQFAADDFPAGLTMPGVSSDYCGDAFHGSFAADIGMGQRDGFIARGYVRVRSPYDWFNHTDALCLYDTLGLCIWQSSFTGSCLDSLVRCGPGSIAILTEFSHVGIGSVPAGPQLSYLWSTGATTDVLGVTASGTYSVQVSTANGCLQWADTIHVIINPLPPVPRISDDVVVNTNALVTSPIYLCPPDSAWLWTTNLPAGHTVQWDGVSGVVNNDSLLANAAGAYHVLFTSPEGCTRNNNVSVHFHPVVPMPDLTADLLISYPQDTDLNDTVALCPGDALMHRYDPTWYIDGLPSPLPPGLVVRYRWHNSPFWSPPATGGTQVNFISVTTGGWHVDDLEVMVTNAPCLGDTLYFTALDSVFVVLHPPSLLSATIQGPPYLCTGDTATLLGSCVGCTSMTWGGAGIVANFYDSVWVNTTGVRSLTVYLTDTNGCTFSQTATHNLQIPPTPSLFVTPPYGVICPDSSATLWTTLPGSQYVWYGPFGADTTTSNSYSTTEPGEYFLFMTDLHGCTHYTTSLTISNYATPFLSVLPDAWLCPVNDSVVLQVSTSALNPPVWWAPLSGAALTQVVTQPGVYTCQVQACGITTVLSVEVLASNVNAALLTPGPFTICPYDTVLLEAQPGMSSYIWQPGAVPGPQLEVSQPGSYQVVAFDAYGCSDTSAVVVVAQHDMGPLAAPADVTVCAGDDAWLVSNGSTLNWYADPAATQWLATGDSLLVPAVSVAATFYLVQSDSVCMLPALPVQVLVDPVPTGLVLNSPGEACVGEALLLTLSAGPGVSTTWTTPSGAFTGSSLLIDPVSLADQGTYTAYTQLGNCSGVPQQTNITVHVPIPFSLGPDVEYCSGGTVVLQIPPAYTSPIWSTGATTAAIFVQSPGLYEVDALDINGCSVRAEVQVIEIDCELVIPNIFTPNGDGMNDTWSMTGVRIAEAHMVIFNRWGQKVYEGDPQRKPFNGIHYVSLEPLTEGVYYYIVDLLRVSGERHEQAGYFQLNR